MESLSVLGGHDKDGRPEDLNLTLRRGDVVCVVGPTGAGKSRFLEDISCLAQGDTPTGRSILVDGEPPPGELRYSLEGRVVAQLSQNMNFIVDLTVGEFIRMHGECRNPAGRGGPGDGMEAMVERIVAAANRLTGEALCAEMPVTRLSGGQSRALMVADTGLLSPSPVVLIDELENAGVDRAGALELLVREDKIVLVSTHDPALALLGARRLCIRGGAVRRVIETSAEERQNGAILSAVNGKFMELREMLRNGASLEFDMASFLKEAVV
ncbi:MAG: ATP-binding cassette domain-containing protein [Treponema sp.]|jgi:ABC-type lipoprotein export system ATPase subunit|nr:ATP-binding cassette domain-containing protein [Treponema sp.]